MPQVDFYVLNSDSPAARDEFVCKLTEKVFKLGKTALILLPDDTRLDQLNRLLWAFPPESFIPHGVVDDQSPPSQEPIQLTAKHPSTATAEVLINLCDTPPPQHQHVDRLVEVVIQQPDILSSTRSHFRFYRDCGYPIQSHDISR